MQPQFFSAIFHFTHWSRSTKSGLQGPGFRFWLHIRITWRGGGGGGVGTRLLQNLWGWVQASVADKALQMIPTCSQGLERFLKCGPSHLQTFWRGKFSSPAPDLPSQNYWVWGRFIALKGDTDAHPDLRPTGLSPMN